MSQSSSGGDPHDLPVLDQDLVDDNDRLEAGLSPASEQRPFVHDFLRAMDTRKYTNALPFTLAMADSRHLLFPRSIVDELRRFTDHSALTWTRDLALESTRAVAALRFPTDAITKFDRLALHETSSIARDLAALSSRDAFSFIGKDLAATITAFREEADRASWSALRSFQDQLQQLGNQSHPWSSLAGCFDTTTFAADLQRLTGSISLLSPLSAYSVELTRAIEQIHSTVDVGALLHFNSTDFAPAGLLSCWDEKAQARALTTFAADSVASLPHPDHSIIEVAANITQSCRRCGKTMTPLSGRFRARLDDLLKLGLDIEIPVMPVCECIATWDGTPEDLLRDPSPPSLQLSVVEGGREGDGRPRAILRIIDR